MMPGEPPALGPKKLILTRAAEADIDAIIDYIAGEAGIEIAYRFAERIDAELAQLAELGHSGASREWVSPGLRLTTIGVYCVYFRVAPNETLIVRVLHGSRDVSQIGFDEPNA
jgi:toxin ParE1/3/4